MVGRTEKEAHEAFGARPVGRLGWGGSLMIQFPSGLEPVEDLGPAAWVHETLKNRPGVGKFLVRDLVPPVFEAYARILHRAHRPEDRRYPTGMWADRADQLGRTLGSEMSWYDLTGRTFAGSEPDKWTPGEGSLSEPEVATLASLLDGHTSTPGSCWFAMWSGWGLFTGGTPLVQDRGWFHRWRMRRSVARARQERRALDRLSTFELFGRSGRSYLLCGGAVSDAARFSFGGSFQSPALWWPEDRAWFVHTEIDASSTYLGGTRSMIDRLVGEQVLSPSRSGRTLRPLCNESDLLDRLQSVAAGTL